MDILTAVVCLAVVTGAVYVIQLAIREGGDFEAGGRSGLHEFFVRSKPRRK